MTEAQFGLVLATPLIVVFAVMLRRMGVLGRWGTATAVASSVAIAGVLYFTQ